MQTSNSAPHSILSPTPPSLKCPECGALVNVMGTMKVVNLKEHGYPGTFQVVNNCPNGHRLHRCYIDNKVTQKRSNMEQARRRIEAGENIPWRELRRIAKRYTVYYHRLQERMELALGTLGAMVVDEAEVTDEPEE